MTLNPAAIFPTLDSSNYQLSIVDPSQTLEIISEMGTGHLAVHEARHFGESPSNSVGSGGRGIPIDPTILQEYFQMKMADEQAGNGLEELPEALDPLDRRADNSSSFGTIFAYAGHGGLDRTKAPLFISSRATPADNQTFEPFGCANPNDHNGTVYDSSLTLSSISQPADPSTSYPSPRCPSRACPTHAPFSYAAVSPQDDPIDNRLAPIQRAFANQSQFDNDGIGGLNKFKVKKVLAINDAETAALCERVKNRDGLGAMVHYIVESAWYKESKQEQLPDHSLQKCLPKRRGKDAKGSPFGAFFSPKAPYICYLCEKPTSRPSVARAIGHARQHFGHTIDGHYTNANTRKDQERRATAPKYHCLYCDKSVTVQNKVRHEGSAGHRKRVQASMATPTTVLQ